MLHKGDDILPIPGTGKEAHLRENAEADQIALSDADLAELEQLINAETVIGPRYGPAMQAAIDTEMFESERAAVA